MSTIEELPSLPSDWKWVSLEEIGKIITGKTPSKKNAEYYGDDIPFYKPTDLNADYYVKESHDNLSYQGAEHARLLPEKSVLVTCIGATIGKTGLIRKKGAFNQQINAIIPLRETIPEYIFYGIKSPQMQKQIKDNASATTLPILNKTKFSSLLFPLAPLNTQNLIVLKLDELFSLLDSGLASLQITKLLLNQYRQAVLKAAMTGELTKEWREKHQHELEPASVLLERILLERKQKWEEEQQAKFQANGRIPKDESWRNKYKEPVLPDYEIKEKLPEEWEIVTIDQISKLISGQHILKSDYNYNKIGYPYLTGPDDFGSKYPKITKWTERPKAFASKKDILITVKGAGVGKTNILNTRDVAISRQLMAMRTTVNTNFIFYFFGANFYKTQKLAVGSTVPGISREEILKISLPMPPILEQNQIVVDLESKLSIISKKINSMELGFQYSNLLKQSILKSAFEGKLVSYNSESKANERIQEKVQDY